MNVFEREAQQYWKLSRAWRRGISAEGLTVGDTIEALGALQYSRSQRIALCAWNLSSQVIDDVEHLPLETSGQIIPLQLRLPYTEPKIMGLSAEYVIIDEMAFIEPSEAQL